MPPCANEQNIAFFDARPVQFFGRVEVFGIDRFAGFKEIDFLNGWNIEHNATRSDAFAGYVNSTFTRAEAPYFTSAEAIVHLAFPEHMTERVEMRKSEAVRSHSEIVERSDRRSDVQ